MSAAQPPRTTGMSGVPNSPTSTGIAGGGGPAAYPHIFGEKRPPECPRCGRDVKANEHVVRLTLVNAEPTKSTDIQGTFHHACAAELFKQFFGQTRGEPLREAS